MKHSDLEQFKGTYQYHQHRVFNLYYTDGVKYFAENAEAHWIIDIIFTSQNNQRIKNDKMLQYFQFWKLTNNEDNTATLICERDEGNIVEEMLINNVPDFPLGEVSLWMIQGTLILPSEY